MLALLLAFLAAHAFPILVASIGVGGLAMLLYVVMLAFTHARSGLRGERTPFRVAPAFDGVGVLRVGLLAVTMLASFVAWADTTSGPTNNLPKVDIPQDNGAANAKGLSLDPQICTAVTSSTGATAATTSFTVMKADTTFTNLRGASVGNTTQGYCVINRSGLYLAEAQCNGSAANGETSTIQVATTTDDSNYTQVSGAQASFVALTGALTQGMHAAGYFTVTSGQAAAGTFHVVTMGKNSAGTLTCKSNLLLNVRRVDTLQPYAYP